MLLLYCYEEKVAAIAGSPGSPLCHRTSGGRISTTTRPGAGNGYIYIYILCGIMRSIRCGARITSTVQYTSKLPMVVQKHLGLEAFDLDLLLIMYYASNQR